MSGLQYLILGFGALLALGGLALLIQRIRTLVSGKVAEGMVVDHKVETMAARRSSGEPTKVYRPVYEFEHEGRTYRCQSSLAVPEARPIGSKVRVRYLPADPQMTAEVDAPLAMWGFPLVAMAFGGFLVVAALGGVGR